MRRPSVLASWLCSRCSSTKTSWFHFIYAVQDFVVHTHDSIPYHSRVSHGDETCNYFPHSISILVNSFRKPFFKLVLTYLAQFELSFMLPCRHRTHMLAHGRPNWSILWLTFPSETSDMYLTIRAKTICVTNAAEKKPDANFVIHG